MPPFTCETSSLARYWFASLEVWSVPLVCFESVVGGLVWSDWRDRWWLICAAPHVPTATTATRPMMARVFVGSEKNGFAEVRSSCSTAPANHIHTPTKSNAHPH